MHLIQLLEKKEKLEREKLEKQGTLSVSCEGEDGNTEEEQLKVSDADIYIATRKRDENRKYKLDELVLKKMKDKIVSSNNSIKYFLC